MDRWWRSVSVVPLVPDAAVVVPGGVKLAAKGDSLTFGGFALALGAAAAVAAGCAVAAGVEVAAGVVGAAEAAGATAAE
jgi:hypothetical protein